MVDIFRPRAIALCMPIFDLIIFGVYILEPFSSFQPIHSPLAMRKIVESLLDLAKDKKIGPLREVHFVGRSGKLVDTVKQAIEKCAAISKSEGSTFLIPNYRYHSHSCLHYLEKQNSPFVSNASLHSTLACSKFSKYYAIVYFNCFSFASLNI